MIAALALAAFACTAAYAEKTFTVSNMDQFLRAIGPDRTIVMKPGTYTVKKGSVKSQYFRWDDAGGGDFQLTILGLSGLTIRAQSDEVGIIASTPYAYVLAFENCESVTLEGLTMGHEASEPCMAGVVSFKDSTEMTVESCDLYGSGAWGINTEGCTGVSLSGTTIRDCSSSAAWIGGTTDVSFENCTIDSNAADPLFYIEETESVTFDECEIANNAGSTAIVITGETMASVEFTECSLTDNDIAEFRAEGEESYVAFTDCTLENNTFGDDPEELAAFTEGYDEGNDENYDEPQTYSHDPSGLTFTIPVGWGEPSEGETEEILQVTDQENVTGVMIIPVYQIPSGGSVKKSSKRYLDEGLKGFIARMKDQKATAAVKLDGDVFDIEGMPAADFRGTGQYDQTDPLVYWVRLVISNDRVWGFIGISDNEDSTSPDSDLGSLMDSITPTPQG